MILRFTLIALALMGSASLATAASQANLIPNPGFEQGLEGWESSFAKGEIAIADAAHSGSKCARFKIDGQIGGIDCTRLFALDEDLQRDGRYGLSAWVKNNGVAKGNWGLRLYFYDDEGEYVE